MEEVKAAELEYYGEYIPLYINYVEFWNTENRVQLDSDSAFTICQYLGQICSLINKDFRNRWTKFVGFCFHYDTLASDGISKKFLAHVTNLTIQQQDPSYLLPYLKNLRKVYFECKVYPHRLESILIVKPEVLLNFSQINKISIDSRLIKYVSHLGSEILENLTVISDYAEIRYRDFLERKEETDAAGIIYKLYNKTLSKTHTIHLDFRSLISFYCLLRSKYLRGNEQISKLKIIVRIRSDILAREYYENVVKKLYNNIGVQTDIKILGHPLPNYGFDPFYADKKIENEVELFVNMQLLHQDIHNDRHYDIHFYSTEKDDKLHEYLVSSARDQDWMEDFEKNDELLISDFDN